MARTLTAEWLCHMRNGDFDAAWRVSDEVLVTGLRTPATRHLHLSRQALWNGEPLDGKRVLIRCCHGLGDTIQFVRYVPLLRRTARRVIVQAQAAIGDLLQHVSGIDAIATLYDEVSDELYDCAVEVMELPFVFRTMLGNVPAETPYLGVQPRHVPRFDGNIAVGLVWQSGVWDKRRSIPVELLAAFDRIPGVTLHILQRGRALAERPQNFGIESGSDDILEAARVIAGLIL
jgi:hypothetical protein